MSSQSFSLRDCGKMLLRSENKPRLDRRVNDFVWQLGARDIIKSLAAAMSWDQVVWIDFLECCKDLVDIIVAEGRHDMKAADHRVHL